MSNNLEAAMYLMISKQQRSFRSKQLRNKRIYFLVVRLPKHDGIIIIQTMYQPSFLKFYCLQVNSTYPLRINTSETNIQLFDITSMSRKRKLKWMCWITMMTYKFTLRLEQLVKYIVPMGDKTVKRFKVIPLK